MSIIFNSRIWIGCGVYEKFWNGSGLQTFHVSTALVTTQLLVRVIPLLYLIFHLMYLHQIVCQHILTPCDVGLHFEMQTWVHNYAFGLGLSLAFRVRVLCQCLK